MVKNVLAPAILAVFCIVGCTDDQQRGANVAKKSSDEAKDVEIISVNGQKLMRSALNAKISFMVKMSELINPKMTVQETQRLKGMLKAGAKNVFIRQVVLSDYLKAEKVEIDPVAIEREQGRLLAKAHMKKGKIGDLKKKVGPYGAELDEYVRARACEATVRAHILAQNPTNLPPNWAAEQIKIAKAYNARMALTNQIVYARATNVWEKLKAGADFKEMARQYTEVPMEKKDGGEWGQLELRQLEPDEELAEWAKKLKVGEFSPPILGDNGLMIMRIDEMKGTDYVLSRIFFRLPMFAAIRSEQELEKRKMAEIRSELISKKIGSLVKAAKVVRPKKNLKSKKQKNATKENKQ